MESSDMMVKYVKVPPDFMFQRALTHIVTSRAFHRLQGKTQVLKAGSHDHARNRLTHTILVSQISKFISDRLRLNSILVEAIAWAHDLGHTPFGHAGERVLNHIMNGCTDDICTIDEIEYQNRGRGFKHNLQSVKVCCDLERYRDKDLLSISNTTKEYFQIMYGIMNHSKIKNKKCIYCSDGNCRHLGYSRNGRRCIYSNGSTELSHYRNYIIRYNSSEFHTVEATLVSVTDEIAQRHHDIMDAIHVGLITPEEVSHEILRKEFPEVWKNIDPLIKSSKSSSSGGAQQLAYCLTNAYVQDILESNAKCVELNEDIAMSKEFSEKDESLKRKLQDLIVNSSVVQRMDSKADYVIQGLFRAYRANPKQMHNPTIVSILNQVDDTKKYEIEDMSKCEIAEARTKVGELSMKPSEKYTACLLRGIADHIAGMTDEYAIREYQSLYRH